jgi:hypothetical protein
MLSPASAVSPPPFSTPAVCDFSFFEKKVIFSPGPPSKNVTVYQQKTIRKKKIGKNGIEIRETFSPRGGVVARLA